MGQTVAASLQAPVIFTIANDLTKMQIDSNVAEADVGVVENDQTVDFTVDAYPERHFPARITQLRFASETVNGVVSYTFPDPASHSFASEAKTITWWRWMKRGNK